MLNISVKKIRVPISVVSKDRDGGLKGCIENVYSPIHLFERSLLSTVENENV